MVKIPINNMDIKQISIFSENGVDYTSKCYINILPSGIEINLQKLSIGSYFIRFNYGEFLKTYKVIKN